MFPLALPPSHGNVQSLGLTSVFLMVSSSLTDPSLKLCQTIHKIYRLINFFPIETSGSCQAPAELLSQRL